MSGYSPELSGSSSGAALLQTRDTGHYARPFKLPYTPMVQQEDDYPGTPSTSVRSRNLSPLSGLTDFAARYEFEIVFMNGTSIKRDADYMRTVGRAVAEAANYLGVSPGEVRLMRGATMLTGLHVKLFDALGDDEKLSAVVVVM